MRTIWKYEVPRDTPFLLELPTGSRVLSVQKQGNTPQMWIEVTPELSKEEIAFHIVGTGTEVPYDCVYIGTWQEYEFVFHLYRSV